jgi:hypothetical protein
MRAALPPHIEVVDDEVAKVLRQMTPAQRIRMAADANDTARILAAGGIRYVHPEWTEARIQQEVARRMLDAAD